MGGRDPGRAVHAGDAGPASPRPVPPRARCPPPPPRAGIGVGAILGAPFMLATLALFVVGASALAFRRREQGSVLRIDEATIGRDMGYFRVFFALAAGVGLLDLPIYLKALAALVLVIGYAQYVRQTLVSGDHLEEVPEKLLLLPGRPNPPRAAGASQARG